MKGYLQPLPLLLRDGGGGGEGQSAKGQSCNGDLPQRGDAGIPWDPSPLA